MRAPAIAVIVLLSGCAGVPRATRDGKILDLWSGISSKEFIRVRGVGVAMAAGHSRSHGQSRDAALVDARYNLLAMIKGVRVSGGVTVAQLMERDGIVRELANEVVSGGEEILTEWADDGGCVITLELKRSTVERLIQEKSDREKGLERRIAEDVRQIERLHDQVMVLAADRYGARDVDELSSRALRAAENWDRLSDVNKRLDSVSVNDMTGRADAVRELGFVIKRLCNNPDGSPNGDCD